jgi:MFS family permease
VTDRLSRDGRLLLVACGIRNAAYSALSVVLGAYLAALGLSPAEVGRVFACALAGSAAATVAVALAADRVGRRRVLLAGAVLMAAGGAAFALARDPAVLALAAVAAAINPSGKEVGPFLAVETAALPQTTSEGRRTAVFAAYNLVMSSAVALGALAVGLPAAAGLTGPAADRALVWGYAAAGALLLPVFASLSPAVEPPAGAAPGGPPAARFGLGRSRGIVARLAALFAVDAFAGGFIVQGLVAYWFHLRFGLEPATIAPLFFAANLAAALSYLAAPRIARRIGLLNTMVFTHLPSNVVLLLVPLAPGWRTAAALLVVRSLLSQLDVPTRQSYVMAVVAPDERSAAAGLTGLARTVATAAAPALAGPALATPALGLPFLVAGGLKIGYDLALLALFRAVKPPEERPPGAAPPTP